MTYGANAPKGFQIANSGGGYTWTGQFNRYQINTTASNAMFTGDPVSLATDGTVILALATLPVLGVFAGCEAFLTSNVYAISFPFWPGGTGGPSQATGTQPWGFVIDDPMAQYTIQETSSASASGTPLTNQPVGNNGNFLASTAGVGSTVNGLSVCSLNNASFATTLTQNVKLVRLDTTITGGVIAAGTPGTSGVQAAGAFANWIVQINNDVYKAGSTRP